MRCVNPKTIFPHRSIEWCDKNEEYPVSVPCGKCLACLSNKRADWSFRLEQEFKYSKGACFVTLTYDAKHLRTNQSLCKRDLQLYFKRLRKSYVSEKIRYYAVGEYGSKHGRPHYHILLFNVLDHEVIRRAWQDSKGFPIGIVHIGSVNAASIAYTLKYMVQPELVPEGLDKPFSLMSRAYGLGGRYLTDSMVDWHRDNSANYAVRDGVNIRLPRFYRSKIWYSVEDREAISKASMLRSLVDQERQRKILEKKFGSNWSAKYVEMRDAQLSRIKSKVAYTQTF